MATNRTPSSNTYWSLITSLVDGDLVTMQRLYSEAIHRLQDNAHYVLGKVAQVYADLASTAAGGNAFTVGNVNITTFDFQAGAALNGLTIEVDEDTSALQTCTFDNSITSPALLLAALTSQAGTNITWSLTSDGFLRAQSNTVGAGSTMAAPAGTAATALFGSASTTSPGSSSVADGTTRVGFAGYSFGSINIAAGTLRNALEEIIVNLEAPNKVTDYSAVDTNQTITEIDGLVLAVDAAAANRTYTLQAPTNSGRRVVVVRNTGGTNAVQVSGFVNGTIVTFAAAVTKAAEFRSIGANWYLVNEWPE